MIKGLIALGKQSSAACNRRQRFRSPVSAIPFQGIAQGIQEMVRSLRLGKGQAISILPPAVLLQLRHGMAAMEVADDIHALQIAYAVAQAILIAT